MDRKAKIMEKWIVHLNNSFSPKCTERYLVEVNFSTVIIDLINYFILAMFNFAYLVQYWPILKITVIQYQIECSSKYSEQATFHVLRAHHFSKGLVGSWRNPFKASNGGWSCSLYKQAKTSWITLLNIRKLYLCLL